jgi:hypothetical protein
MVLLAHIREQHRLSLRSSPESAVNWFCKISAFFRFRSPFGFSFVRPFLLSTL